MAGRRSIIPALVIAAVALACSSATKSFPGADAACQGEYQVT
jgi:hypothetical protein